VDEFASHREQVESLLRLADEYELSELDRDRVREAIDGTEVGNFSDPRAGQLAMRLRTALEDAEHELSAEQVEELRAIIRERLPTQF
jgi:hypothetical protein